MICYKDKTFCPFWETCLHGTECDRALTEEVKKAAKDFGLPTALFATPPRCYKKKEEKEKIYG